MSKTRVGTRSYPSLKRWRQATMPDIDAAAEKLAVSRSTYLRWERGERFPKGPKALFVTQETGVPLETLLGDR